MTKKELERQLLVNTSILNRLAVAAATGKTFGGKRDMYEVLGYKQTPAIEDYIARYLRQDIAKRIIDAYPNAIWTNDIKVQTSLDDSGESEFDKQFMELSNRLRLYHYMNRLDRLSQLGTYAVLLIGLNDNQELNEPVTRVSSLDDIIYLMPFAENNALVTSFEEDKSNERYGLPLIYKLTTGGYSGQHSRGKSSTMPSQTLEVHHSRVLHISEGLLDNEVFGVPKLQPIFNRLDDLEKVVGGSAEIYWLNSRGGLSLNADKDTSVEDPKKLKEHAEDYVHQLSRILRTQGMDVKTLELEVFSPDKHASVILDLISGTTGIPKRILVGSERGELASSQDEKNWLARVNERRVNYCEPFVLRPFIDRLITWGALKGIEYYVTWSELMVMTDMEKSEIASKKAQAISDYVLAVGSDMVVPPKQFVEEILGMDYKEDDIENDLNDERDDEEDNTDEGEDGE